MDHLTEAQIESFKTRLEAERARLEEELASVGKKDEEQAGDWAPKTDDLDIMEADRNETADRLEELEDNTAILNDLEIQLNRVHRALQKIEAGTYGRCEVSGEPIPLERLEANPAALTTVEHASKLHE